jgi:DNA-binding CsgD family transcriptional regulator
LKVAQIEGIRGRRREGRYHKPQRDIAQKEIRRLIVEEGLSNRQISERINIPLKTVERYVKDLYARDNEMLKGLSGEEERLTSWNIARDRLENHKQEILASIARNQKAPFKDQLKAWNLICELEAADLRILEETLAMVVRSSALPVKQVLTLKKKEEVYEEENEKVSTEISHPSKNPSQEEKEYDELEE